MGFKTKIQWCEHTWNGWIGCSKVNEGCKFCYAEQLMDHRYGRVEWGDSGTRSRTKTWRDPIKWNREAEKAGERHKVFCMSLADVFEDRPELEPWRADLFELIDKCGSLDWLLLTKRPENIIGMWPGFMSRENVWLGTSIANQRNADECLPRLLECRGLSPVLFVSLEPQIGDVTLREFMGQGGCDWVITGGESKQGPMDPRPFNLQWARRTQKECQVFDRPWFFKQFGSNAWDGDRRLTFVDSHGGDMIEWPQDVRVRECPESFYPVLV